MPTIEWFELSDEPRKKNIDAILCFEDVPDSLSSLRSCVNCQHAESIKCELETKNILHTVDTTFYICNEFEWYTGKEPSPQDLLLFYEKLLEEELNRRSASNK